MIGGFGLKAQVIILLVKTHFRTGMEQNACYSIPVVVKQTMLCTFSSPINSPNLIEHHSSNLPLQLRLSKHISNQSCSHISAQHNHIATVLVSDRQQATSRVQAEVSREEAIGWPRLHEAKLSRVAERPCSDRVRGNGGAVRRVRVGKGEDARVAVGEEQEAVVGREGDAGGCVDAGVRELTEGGYFLNLSEVQAALFGEVGDRVGDDGARELSGEVQEGRGALIRHAVRVVESGVTRSGASRRRERFLLSESLSLRVDGVDTNKVRTKVRNDDVLASRVKDSLVRVRRVLTLRVGAGL